MKTKIQTRTGHKIINLNRRMAIRAKCLNCSGWGYREVEICPFQDCQLYPFRSGKGYQDPKVRSKSIRRFCLWCSADSHTEIRKCPAVYCPLHVFRKGKPDLSLEILFLSEKRPHMGRFQKD